MLTAAIEEQQARSTARDGSIASRQVDASGHLFHILWGDARPANGLGRDKAAELWQREVPQGAAEFPERAAHSADHGNFVAAH